MGAPNLWRAKLQTRQQQLRLRFKELSWHEYDHGPTRAGERERAAIHAELEREEYLSDAGLMRLAQA